MMIPQDIFPHMITKSDKPCGYYVTTTLSRPTTHIHTAYRTIWTTICRTTQHTLFVVRSSTDTWLCTYVCYMCACVEKNNHGRLQLIWNRQIPILILILIPILIKDNDTNTDINIDTDTNTDTDTAQTLLKPINLSATAGKKPDSGWLNWAVPHSELN